jgi:hypothetical protein
MKRAFLLLAIAVLLFVLSLASVVHAGTSPGLQVGPYTQSITLSNRYASWRWQAQVSPTCPGTQLVSVREYVGQSFGLNNFPGKQECVRRTAYRYYDPYIVPSRFDNDWYGESGTVIEPRYYLLTTYVFGN